jgi:hypothetical protein
VAATLPRPSLGLVLALVVIPRVVLVLGPWMVLVLDLVLHFLWALDDEVPVLPTLVAHARAPMSVLPVHVHALEPRS